MVRRGCSIIDHTRHTLSVFSSAHMIGIMFGGFSQGYHCFRRAGASVAMVWTFTYRMSFVLSPVAASTMFHT